MLAAILSMLHRTQFFFARSVSLLSRFTLIMIVLHLLCPHEMDSHLMDYGFCIKKKLKKEERNTHNKSHRFAHTTWMRCFFMLSMSRLTLLVSSFFFGTNWFFMSVSWLISEYYDSWAINMPKQISKNNQRENRFLKI